MTINKENLISDIDRNWIISNKVEHLNNKERFLLHKMKTKSCLLLTDWKIRLRYIEYLLNVPKINCVEQTLEIVHTIEN